MKIACLQDHNKLTSTQIGLSEDKSPTQESQNKNKNETTSKDGGNNHM